MVSFCHQRCAQVCYVELGITHFIESGGGPALIGIILVETLMEIGLR
jgi:hypothetical protein